LLLCHGTVCVVGKMRDLILQLSKSSIYSTKLSAKVRFIQQSLEMLVTDGGRKIFIWDFDKGVAIFSEGITGKQSKYIVQGEKHAGHINLIRDNTIERTIYGVKEFTCGNGDSGKSSPVFCSLCEGQILIIECQKAFIRKPLRLDELTFE
ncbi:hypothetical protein, partial [Klebsiella pneumoniae]|uniref:hypothetical protein n=1 Tax=Klebsiella pneumoniae TaxID=573 RepID=UPI002380A8D4